MKTVNIDWTNNITIKKNNGEVLCQTIILEREDDFWDPETAWRGYFQTLWEKFQDFLYDDWLTDWEQVTIICLNEVELGIDLIVGRLFNGEEEWEMDIPYSIEN